AGAGYAVWRHLRHQQPHWQVRLAALIALLLHALSLLHSGLQAGTLVLGVGTVLSLFAWQSALLLWLFSLRGAGGVLRLIVYPVAGVCALIAWAMPPGSAAVDALGWESLLHIGLSMLAYGLLTLGAVQALILALQHHQLRRRPPAPFVAMLPPLETMETLL